MSHSKTVIVLTMVLSFSLQAFDAAARVGSSRSGSSMSSSRSYANRPAAEPQRAGGGTDAGMQRPDVMNKVRGQEAGAPTSTAVPSPQPVGTATAPTSAQPAKPGYGIGTVVGAAAAGAAVGYLANSAMHDNPAPQNQMAPSGSSANYGEPLSADRHVAGASSSPWGFILLLIAGTAAIIGALMFLSRRREAADRIADSSVLPHDTAQAHPDNAEHQEFERNALKFFNELQDANNRGDIAYMEANSLEPIKRMLIDDIRNRASSSRTQVMMMNANLVDMTEEADQSIASVRFRGMVSEDENASPDRIDEVWHFVRAKSSEAGWKLAGIEQV